MKKKSLCYLAIFVIAGFLSNCSNRHVNNQIIENLKESVTRENRASTVYKSYEIQAKKEYFFQIAKLFKSFISC